MFAVQLHGQKCWSVGESERELMCGPGDVIYLPAGTSHRAETGDAPSLHLTIGIHRPTSDKIAASALELARRRVPNSSVDGSSGPSLGDVVEALGEVSEDAAIERLRRPPRTPTVGLLAASVRRPVVELESLIGRITDWQLELDDATSRVAWSGRILFVPPRAAEALVQIEQLGADETLAVRELRGLTPDERMVLARRLLDEGAVTLAQPALRAGADVDDHSDPGSRPDAGAAAPAR